MADLLEQAAQLPHFEYTPPVAQRSSNYKLKCPKCRGPWSGRKSGCRSCFMDSLRPPEDSTVYVVDDVNCRRIPLTCDQYMLVLETDYQFLRQWPWAAVWSAQTRSWYAYIKYKIDGKSKTTIRPHHVLFGIPPSEPCDHHNHNTLDNRRVNLRRCTYSQNSAARGMMKNNTSGFTGVTWNCGHEKWHAQLRLGRRCVNLGYYSDKYVAVVARAHGAVRYFGEFASTFEKLVTELSGHQTPLSTQDYRGDPQSLTIAVQFREIVDRAQALLGSPGRSL